MKHRPQSADIHTPKDSARCNALTSALRCAEVNDVLTRAHDYAVMNFLDVCYKIIRDLSFLDSKYMLWFSVNDYRRHYEVVIPSQLFHDDSVM